ncbi:DUF2478 domain-containing protein [Xanthobacter sp. V3C-3]|uniref:DUF2478 domain-containing protein n=1 Tax=Xanthobacter lutulentifluminis TaxID=3119935 RepID=UPI003728403D
MDQGRVDQAMAGGWSLSRSMILAVQGGDRETIQALLAASAQRMRGIGLRVIGVVEHLPPGGAHEDVLLLDLVSGETHRLHQDLGPGASGCSLDPAGLAAASAGVERAVASRLAEGGDLSDTVVVLSKFGRQEAEGRGLTSAFHAAVAAELRVLTSVSPTVRAEWDGFAGDLAVVAPPEPALLEDWYAPAAAEAP